MSRENLYRSLTKKQRVILDAIRFFLRKGEIPTVREVGALVGLRSPATVLKHLRALEKAKLITLTGKSRGIRLAGVAGIGGGMGRIDLGTRAGSPLQTPRETDPRETDPRETVGPRLSHRAPPTGDTPAREVPRSFRGRRPRIGRIPIVGAIAAGRPFESYDEGFFRPDGGFNAGGRYGGAAGDEFPWLDDDYSPTRSAFPHAGGDPSSRDPSSREKYGDAWSSRFSSTGYSPGGLTDGSAAEGEEGWFFFEDEESDTPEGREPYPRLLAEAEDTGFAENSSGGGLSLSGNAYQLPVDPRMFVDSGDVFALRVEGDSMVNAGILDGDFVIIRRQETVEEGEIAAVIIDGEGTLKRWHSQPAANGLGLKHVSLEPANERFEPIEISQDEGKNVLVFGKYVGLVRGNLRTL